MVFTIGHTIDDGQSEGIDVCLPRVFGVLLVNLKLDKATHKFAYYRYLRFGMMSQCSSSKLKEEGGELAALSLLV